MNSVPCHTLSAQEEEDEEVYNEEDRKFVQEHPDDLVRDDASIHQRLDRSARDRDTHSHTYAERE